MNDKLDRHADIVNEQNQIEAPEIRNGSRELISSYARLIALAIAAVGVNCNSDPLLGTPNKRIDGYFKSIFYPIGSTLPFGGRASETEFVLPDDPELETLWPARITFPTFANGVHSVALNGYECPPDEQCFNGVTFGGRDWKLFFAGTSFDIQGGPQRAQADLNWIPVDREKYDHDSDGWPSRDWDRAGEFGIGQEILDCDDEDNSVSPIAHEVCGNGIDEQTCLPVDDECAKAKIKIVPTGDDSYLTPGTREKILCMEIQIPPNFPYSSVLYFVGANRKGFGTIADMDAIHLVVGGRDIAKNLTNPRTDRIEFGKFEPLSLNSNLPETLCLEADISSGAKSGNQHGFDIREGDIGILDLNTRTGPEIEGLPLEGTIFRVE